MASKVSFIIQLKDQFGRTAAKVNRQFEKIKKNADKANKSVVAMAKKGQASLGEFSRKAAKSGAVVTAALTVPIWLLTKKMISAASAAQEVDSKFGAIFNTLGDKGPESVSRLSKEYKLATSTAKDMLSSTGAILSASGLSKKRILALSEALNGASIDLASFHDFQGDAKDSSMILSKALLGEAETLKTNFGITILQNKAFQDQVKAKQRSLGLSQQAAKAEVIFASIMKQAGKDGQNALGNFNLTAHEYANTVRINNEASKDLAESFGTLLLPMATKLTTKLTTLFKWVGKLPKPMKTLILVLAGLVAIGGPLLLLLGGIAFAMAAISLPVLAVVAAVGLLIAAGVMLTANWDDVVDGGKLLWSDFSSFMSDTADKIGGFFTNMWEGIKSGLVSFVNFGIVSINALLAPLNFVAEKLGVGSIGITPVSAPSAPTSAANGTLNGQITVAASPGSQVKETSMATTGKGLNIGMNMAAL